MHAELSETVAPIIETALGDPDAGRLGGDTAAATTGCRCSWRHWCLGPRRLSRVCHRRAGRDARRSMPAPPLIPATRSRSSRKRVEDAFGWAKTVASLRKPRHRGRLAVHPGDGPPMILSACPNFWPPRPRELARCRRPSRSKSAIAGRGNITNRPDIAAKTPSTDPHASQPTRPLFSKRRSRPDFRPYNIVGRQIKLDPWRQ
jgi:hypothetical protein